MIHLENKKGASVWLSELGAGIISVIVPDKDGNMGDIALGYKDSDSYKGDGACMGKIAGRYANRIALGKFELDGKHYQLAINNPPNHLHGGPNGFQNKIWEIIPNSDKAQNCSRVEFAMKSEDGDEGYPGALQVNAIYKWSDDNILTLEIIATTDSSTILNLTNHCYWNLSGEDSGSILDQKLYLNASKWLPTDSTLIPSGEIENVSNTPMDFTISKKIGRDINQNFNALKYGKGYDNCWIIDKNGDKIPQLAAILTDNKSGRKMEVYTTQSAIQVYTGNWLNGSPISKSGRSYNDYEGVAIECQNFPDAPNKPNFPSPILRKTQEYRHIIEFRFSVI